MVRVQVLAVVAMAALCGAARAEEPPLKTGVDGTFAPHAMPKLTGGVEGFNVDLAEEIGRRLGRKVEIEATQFSGLLPGLAAGTYDFIAAPGNGALAHLQCIADRACALIYLVLLWPVVRLVSRLEHRIAA